MAIQIVKKTYQARGEFNGGEILENKPLGFPREGGTLTPYSNLFYWAHAWSDKGSTIGLHPHQGFEIMSFVVDGSIEHFDTAHNEWKKLEKGDAQIIRAGNGISHSEKINAGGHMFQIWFDPNLQKTLQQGASYDDYPHDSFSITKEKGIKTKVYKGEGAPIEMDTQDVEIVEKWVEKGEQELLLDKGKVHSFYVINGKLEIDGKSLGKDDFFIVKEAEKVEFEVQEEVHFFIVSSPQQLDYRTYAQSYGR